MKKVFFIKVLHEKFLEFLLFKSFFQLHLFHLPFKFVHTRVLIIMNPSNAIKVTHAAHIFGKFLGLRPCEVINDGNDVAVGC
jgi:hypothetical protein